VYDEMPRARTRRVLEHAGPRPRTTPITLEEPGVIRAEVGDEQACVRNIVNNLVWMRGILAVCIRTNVCKGQDVCCAGRSAD
jgi:hypothetical protein